MDSKLVSYKILSYVKSVYNSDIFFFFLSLLINPILLFFFKHPSKIPHVFYDPEFFFQQNDF